MPIVLFNILASLIVIGIPLYCLMTQKHQFLIGWICITIGVDILNIDAVGSFRAAEVAGLIYLPNVFVHLSNILSSRIGKSLAVYAILLMCLGVLFGLLLPWPDTTGERPWFQQAQGRTISALVTYASYFSLVVYFAVQVARGFSISRILKYLVWGTTLVATGVIIQAITGFDYFGYVKPDMAFEGLERLRGLAGEPRAAGQLIAMGVLILIVSKVKLYLRWPIVLIHMVGLALTVSTSGLLVLGFGLLLSALISANGRKKVIPLMAAGAVLIWGLNLLSPRWLELWGESLVGRLVEEDQYAVPATNLAERIASNLEVFDASAFLFLWDNPFYSLIGTGPGLVSLPASSYVPDGMAKLIYGSRIDSIPHMGILRIVSESGLVGLSLFVLIILGAYSAVITARAQIESGDPWNTWTDASKLIVIFGGVYLIQVHEIIYVAWGIGLGAALIPAYSAKRYPMGSAVQPRLSTIQNASTISPRPQVLGQGKGII